MQSFDDSAIVAAISGLQIRYATQLDEVSSLTYVGKAAPGSSTSLPVWQIQRLDESGSPELIITFADGDSNFDNIWDDRLLLSYS